MCLVFHLWLYTAANAATITAAADDLFNSPGREGQGEVTWVTHENKEADCFVRSTGNLGNFCACVCVYACVRVFAWVRAWVRACVRGCVPACVCVRGCVRRGTAVRPLREDCFVLTAALRDRSASGVQHAPRLAPRCGEPSATRHSHVPSASARDERAAAPSQPFRAASARQIKRR